MVKNEAFDPYRKWLGIPPSEQPPTHYRLLGIAEFEDDLDVISHAADRCMAHVRTFQTGAKGELSQKILNELSDARVTLLDRRRKKTYDVKLRTDRKAASPPPPPAAAPPTEAPPAEAPPAETVGAQPLAEGAPVAEEPIIGSPVAPTAHAAPAFQAPSRPASSARRRSRKKSSPMPALLVAAGVLGVVILAVVAASSNSGSQPTDHQSRIKRIIKPARKHHRAVSGPRQTEHKPTTRNERPEKPDPNSDTDPLDDGSTGARFTGELTINEALAEVRRATVELDFDSARKRLRVAKDLGETDEHRERIANTGKLVDYYEQFFKALIAGAEALEPETQLNRGRFSLTFVGLRREPETIITLDEDGSRNDYKLTELRPRAALAIARRPLVQSGPQAKLYEGTYLALSPQSFQQGNERVRQLWFEALQENLADESLIVALGLPYEIVLAEKPPTKRKPKAGNKSPNDRRLEVPGEDALRDARREVRELFKDDFTSAKTNTEKAALAQKLYKTADQYSKSPAHRYVLLERAMEVAVELANAQAFLSIIDDLADAFQIDRMEWKSIQLTKALRNAQSVEDGRELYKAASWLFREAKAKARYDVAERAARVASSAAQRAKDTDAMRSVDAELKKIESLRVVYEAADKARAALEENPDDPDANTELGQFECCIEGTWNEGLARLAKGGNKELSDLAQQDLASPQDAEDQFDLGEGWLAAAKRSPEALRPGMLGRARRWYEQSRNQSEGTPIAAQASRRIGEIEKLLTELK